MHPLMGWQATETPDIFMPRVICHGIFIEEKEESMNKRLIGIIALVVVCMVMFTCATDLMAKEDPAAKAKRDAMVAAARKTLANQQWIIYLSYNKEKKGELTKVIKSGSDVLSFTERKVLSSKLANEGYNADGTNFSIRAYDDGTIVWETLQSHPNGSEQASLRGELRGPVMTGSVIYRNKGKVTRTMFYTTVMP